jgi:hypothetical protein
MIVVPASLRSDFIHMAGITIHIALESTIHIVGIRTCGGHTLGPVNTGIRGSPEVRLSSPSHDRETSGSATCLGGLEGTSRNMGRGRRSQLRLEMNSERVT